MIDFRYHVVSIIAVFLALTVGLVIGASVINQATVQLLNEQLNSANSTKLGAQLQVRNLQSSATLYQQYIDQTAPTLVDNQLSGSAIAVVRLAGEDDAVANAVEGMIQRAGAVVTVDVTVDQGFAAPANAAALAQITATCTPAKTTLQGTGASAAMQLLAQVLGTYAQPLAGPTDGASTSASASATPTPTVSAAATPSGGLPGCGPKPDTMNAAWAAQVLDEFSAAGVITVNQKSDSTEKPAAAYIAAPDTPGTANQNAAYLSLAEGLRGVGVGPVVGGTANAVGTGGLISAVLADSTAAKAVSTVDDTDQTIGQVAVVFVILQVQDDPTADAGHYGLTGTTDGLLPALPTTAATG